MTARRYLRDGEQGVFSSAAKKRKKSWRANAADKKSIWIQVAISEALTGVSVNETLFVSSFHLVQDCGSKKRGVISKNCQVGSQSISPLRSTIFRRQRTGNIELTISLVQRCQFGEVFQHVSVWFS